MRTTRIMSVVGLAAAIAMTLAACGGSGDSDAKGGVTLTKDGALSEPVTINVAIAAKAAPLVPVLMSDTWPEFKDRNITLNVKIVPTSDSMALLSTGKLDAALTGPTVGMYNAIASGADVRIVAPGTSHPEGTKAGIYVSTKALGGKKFEPSMLKGKKFSSTSGNTGVSMYAVAQLLKGSGISPKDLNLVSLTSPDTIAALESGAVFAGIVLEPLNIPLTKNHAGIMVAPQGVPGFPNTTLIFGKTLLDDQPEAVGRAFVAALRDTYKNHLQGDFLKDPETAKAIAAALDQPVESIQQGSSGIFPTTLSFPDNYVNDIESVWREWPDLLTYEKPLETKQVIDDRFMTWVNSH
jgi:NitT/TauT family transport system substrate-binding protein